jgi:transposase
VIRSPFQRHPINRGWTQVEALFAQAVAADIAGVSGSCADILAHKAALFTFVDRDGVDPTNNHAER